MSNPRCEVDDCIYIAIYGKKSECTIPSSITITDVGGLFIAGCGYTFEKIEDEFNDRHLKKR